MQAAGCETVFVFVRERASQPVFLSSLVSLEKINFIVLFFTDVVVGQITNSEEKRKEKSVKIEFFFHFTQNERRRIRNPIKLKKCGLNRP
jgi:hypothetical protein